MLKSNTLLRTFGPENELTHDSTKKHNRQYVPPTIQDRDDDPSSHKLINVTCMMYHVRAMLWPVAVPLPLAGSGFDSQQLSAADGTSATV